MSFKDFDREISVFAVDDDDFILDLFRENLEDIGITVHTFTSAVDALKAWRDGKVPDLVISDIHMPEIDGMEFIKELRDGQYTKPVIVVTGFADKQRAITALSMNVNAMLEKPFSTEELIHRVKTEIVSDIRSDINKDLLTQFSKMTDEMGGLLAKFEDRFSLAENIITDAKVELSKEDHLTFLKNAKLSRELDSLMTKSKRTIKDMTALQSELTKVL